MDAAVANQPSPPHRHSRRADRRTGIDALVRGVAADLLNTNNRRNFAMLLTQRLAQLAVRLLAAPGEDEQTELAAFLGT